VVVLVVATLLAWLLLRREHAGPADDAANSSAAAAVDAKQAGSPVPASALPARPGNGGTAPAHDAAAAAATSGMGFVSTAAPPDGGAVSPGRATSDAQDDANQFPRFWRRCRASCSSG